MSTKVVGTKPRSANRRFPASRVRLPEGRNRRTFLLQVHGVPGTVRPRGRQGPGQHGPRLSGAQSASTVMPSGTRKQAETRWNMIPASAPLLSASLSVGISKVALRVNFLRAESAIT